MATTQFNNRLITPELTEALSSYPLYSGNNKFQQPTDNARADRGTEQLSPVFSGREEEGCTLHRSVLPWQYPLVHHGRTAGRQ